MVGPKEEIKRSEEIKQQYQKILKEFKYKKEVLERKKKNFGCKTKRPRQI